MHSITPPVVADFDCADVEDIGALRDIVGFHIRLAHGAVYRHFTENFGHLELTQKQIALLWLVDDHPGIAQSGVAARMRMDRATTMAIVNRLEARDLLIRGRSPTDGRKQTLNLTQQGQETLVVARDAIRRHEDWLKARYTRDEVETLITLLSRLRD